MLKWSQWLYRLAVEEVPDQDYMLPLSEAEVCYLNPSMIIICRLINPQISGDSGREWCNTCWMGGSASDHGTGLYRCWEGTWPIYLALLDIFEESSEYVTGTGHVVLLWNLLTLQGFRNVETPSYDYFSFCVYSNSTTWFSNIVSSWGDQCVSLACDHIS